MWQEGICTLLHTRLRIIDTSARADQPMQGGPSARVVMVYNGEVYNFRVLRRELEQAGWSFNTESDAEVLLKGYAHWGHAVFRRARGMWAAAFWHPANRRVTLVRDPLGKKPLLYHLRNGRFVFASNMAALLTLLEVTPDVDPAAVDCYLAHLVVPVEHSAFSGVRKVLPGSIVSWSPEGELEVDTYWRVPAQPEPGLDDPVEEIERLLRSAVRRRLESDVPLGVFLSAGYDSGLVAAIAAQESARPLVAVTAGTRGSEFDERAGARAVATRYGMDHHCLEVPPLSAESLPFLLGELGEPFGDPSVLPSYEVARAARRDITVALTGDGGDEGFFGYSTFGGVHWAQVYRRIVPSVLRVALRALTRGVVSNGLWRRAAAVFDYGAGPLHESYRNRIGFAAFERSALLKPAANSAVHHRAEHVYRDRLAKLRGLPDADALRRVFYETYLANDYLPKVDAATMAASLEARCPFLDVDLVEYVLGLPASVAFPRARAKALLRPLARKLLPPELVSRRKTGFGIPVSDWLRGELDASMEEFVYRRGTFVASAIDTEAVRQIAKAHSRGADYGTQLWALLALGVWGAVFVDRRWRASDPLPVTPRAATSR
jgi:asparagine synthase (glutamine-hydrolysing)